MSKGNSNTWEHTLEKQCVNGWTKGAKAYVCSPLSADNREQLHANIRTARAYMFLANRDLGYAARAPHAYLPLLLNDSVPVERALAIDFGLRLLEQSEILLVCGSRISCGMEGEIRHAAKLKMKILAFDKTVHLGARRIVADCGGDKYLVRLDDRYPQFVREYPDGITPDSGEVA